MVQAATISQATLTPAPGRVLGLVGAPGSGLTRLALSLLADYARVAPVAYVDVRGWFYPLAAWETGIEPDRLIVVRCRDSEQWPRVVGSLIDGFQALYAEIPGGVREPVLRRVAALARARKAAVMLRPLGGELPENVAFVRVEAQRIEWEGADAGHGHLRVRRMSLLVSGKGVPEHRVEVLDDGSHALRVVSRLASAPVGRAVG